MRKILILILTIFPLTILAQELKCCKTIKEAEAYLNGNWKKKDSEPNQQYRFVLNNGTGKFKILTIKDDGSLEKSETEQPEIKLLKTPNGFKIEHDFGGLKTYSGIKVLNSSKLILTRRDGAEMGYYKISG